MSSVFDKPRLHVVSPIFGKLDDRAMLAVGA
jgi:hypothetical protein